MLKLKQNVAEHFFTRETVQQALAQPDKTLLPRKPEIKVKVKYHDKDMKSQVGIVVGISDKELIEVCNEETKVVDNVNPKNIIGAFIVTYGREVEINFGVGRVTISSLIDE